MPVARRPRTNHIDLAQRIIEVARSHGFAPGARLPEQQLATLCSVSRTPVRAALRLLEAQGAVSREEDAGYRLAIDLTRPDALAAGLPRAAEDDLAAAILRDRAARRLDASVTVAALARRYGSDRKTVLKSLNILAEDNVVERAPGQSWLFRPSPDGPDALAESYAFRLLLEPAAILTPGFRLDGAAATALRDGMEALSALPDAAFDAARFRRLDADFHGLVARGCPNRFLADALAAHLKLRRLPGAYAGVSLYRQRQSIREHLAILDQLESGQHEIAADLMRVHLRASRSQRPQAASRGAPALSVAGGRPA